MSDDRLKQSEWANRLAFIDGVIGPGDEPEDLPVAAALEEVKTAVGKRRKRRTPRRRRYRPSVYDFPPPPSEFVGSLADSAKEKVAKRIQEFAAELLRKEAVSVAVMLYREAKKQIEVFTEEEDTDKLSDLAFEITEMFRACLRFYEIGERAQDALEIRGVLAIWYANVILPFTENLEGKINLAKEIETLAWQVINSLQDNEVDMRQRMEELLERPEIADLL